MMRGRLQAALVACVALVSFGAPTNPASAMTVLPLDLPALTRQAGRIFVGRVEDVRTGRDVNGLPAVWTTFAVAEPIKETTTPTLTLKQLGTALGDAPHPGLPRFRPGESVVLFVQPESALGFTSPVGLGQGCFRLHQRNGMTVAENDLGNRNLTSESPALRAPGAATNVGAPLPLETLLTRVRALVDSTTP